MKMMSKEQLRQFIKKNNLKSAEDVQNVLEELFAECGLLLRLYGPL